MRIVEIIPQLHIGGAEHFTVNLCNELVNQGHEVTLIVTNPIQKYGHFSKYLDSRVRLISMDKKAGPDINLFFKLPKLILKLRPDIVHTHLGAIVYNILSPLIFSKAKYFHTIHNTAEKEATTGGYISAIARKFQFNLKTVKPITISKETHKSFEKYYGKKIKPTLILNGVPKGEISESSISEMESGILTLVNVARVMPQKNHLELVKAVEELNNEGYPIILYIIGYNDTPEGNEIKSMNLKYSHLLGPKSNPLDYMAKADGFILSSIYEGMPLTLIESMSIGKISICTPVGGIKDMITDGVNGILSKDTSKESLKEAIIRFINLSQDKREQISSNASASYNDYTMTKCTLEYLDVFNKQK